MIMAALQEAGQTYSLPGCSNKYYKEEAEITTSAKSLSGG
jgi:hypothetical protein